MGENVFSETISKAMQPWLAWNLPQSSLFPWVAGIIGVHHISSA